MLLIDAIFHSKAKFPRLLTLMENSFLFWSMYMNWHCTEIWYGDHNFSTLEKLRGGGRGISGWRGTGRKYRMRGSSFFSQVGHGDSLLELQRWRIRLLRRSHAMLYYRLFHSSHRFSFSMPCLVGETYNMFISCLFRWARFHCAVESLRMTFKLALLTQPRKRIGQAFENRSTVFFNKLMDCRCMNWKSMLFISLRLMSNLYILCIQYTVHLQQIYTF